jgi:hypothetical protein
MVGIPAEVKKVVCFIGELEGTKFHPRGTAFFVEYERFAYLITAKHVVCPLSNLPFCIRFNDKVSGTSIVHFDPPVDGRRWYYHQDHSVDVAVFPAGFIGDRANF